MNSKQFKKLLENTISDMSAVMEWQKSAKIFKSKPSKIVPLIAPCSVCQQLPRATIASNVYYCIVCKVILIVKSN